VTVTVTNENEFPVFVSNDSFTVPENTTAVATVQATDVDGGTITYGIESSSTDDSHLFFIHPNSGVLTFILAPDFEKPSDKNSDNVYGLMIVVENSHGLRTRQELTVTVTDVQEQGTIVSPDRLETPENQQFVTTIIVEDPDAQHDRVYSIDGGSDAAMFTLSSTGVLSFAMLPDFEAPADFNRDNDYEVMVKVVDNSELLLDALYQTLHVVVTNVNEAPFAIAKQYSTNEDSKLEISASNGLLIGYNDPEGDLVEAVLISQTQYGSIIISADGRFSYQPNEDFYGRDEFTFALKDQLGIQSAIAKAVIQVSPVNDAPESLPQVFSVEENSLAGTWVGTVVAKDRDGDALRYSLAQGEDFTVSESGIITVAANAVLDYESNPRYKLVLSIEDEAGLTVLVEVEVNLVNMVEKTDLVIVSAQSADSVWRYPDTIWVNQSNVRIDWSTDGVLAYDSATVQSNAITSIIKSGIALGKDQAGADTLVVVMNNKVPVIEFELPPTRTEPTPGVTVSEPIDPSDPVIYINDKEREIPVVVTVIDGNMNPQLIRDLIKPDLHEGLNDITYTYTDLYGNTSTRTIQVYLDLTPPVVKITSPADRFRTDNVVQVVNWEVDGVSMNILNLQTLKKGINKIVRTYRDRAGNEGSDTVLVYFEEGKSIEVALERELMKMDLEEIEKFYSINPPKDEELYSISLLNHETGLEEKTQYGLGGVNHQANGEEPYPGMSGKHLGPTLRIRIRVPQMGGTNAMGDQRSGLLRDLVDASGNVAISAGAGSEKITVPLQQYVTEHCLAESFNDLTPDAIMQASQFKSQVSLKVHVFDATGQFVDRMMVLQEIKDASYLDDAGVLTLFFEIKPSRNHGLLDVTGREYGTGAFIINAKVVASSVRRCDMPDGPKGEVLKSDETILQKFGYVRDNFK